MIIQGTTPTHAFTIPFEVEMIKSCAFTYEQNDEIKLEKNKSECVMSGNIVQTTLSQTDTFVFDKKGLVKVYLKILTTEGDIYITPIRRLAYKSLANTEVMT